MDPENASEFLYYNENTRTLVIDDLNDPSVVVGEYTLIITLDDQIKSVEVEVSLVIAEADLCNTAPEIVSPISTDIFTLNINEETFIEFQSTTNNIND